MRIFMFIALILAFCPPLDAAEVTDIRIGKHPDKTRLVMEITGNPDFNARILDNPARLVIHLPAKTWAIGGDTQMISPLRTVHHAVNKTLTPTVSEITFNLDRPAIIRNAMMLPADQAHPANRLVIDLALTDQMTFRQNLAQIHGPLIAGSAQAVSLDGLLKTIAQNTTPIPATKPTQAVSRKPVIVIDAGHGGQDPGAISPGGIREKDITLPLAKTIARILNSSGRYDARLTRTKDVYIKLHDRVTIARKANADIFLSVHADSVGNHTTRGASVYTLSDTASDAQTAKLAARENRSDIIAGVDLGIEDHDVSLILLDLSMRDTMNQSKYLANTVIRTLGTGGIPTLRGPHRYAGFAVLKAPDVPSVLIEAGFVSNEAEARRLKTPAYQQQVARSILNALDHYFAQ